MISQSGAPVMDQKYNSSSGGGTMHRHGTGVPVPVLPARNQLRRPNSSHFPQSGATSAARFHFRKGLARRCSWKCAAIAFILLSVLLAAAISYISS